MPDMDGFEATAAIRETETSHGRPDSNRCHDGACHGRRPRALPASGHGWLCGQARTAPLSFSKSSTACRQGHQNEKRLSRSGQARGSGSRFDEAALLDRFKGDARLAAKLARLFLADQSRLMANIEKAVAAPRFCKAGPGGACAQGRSRQFRRSARRRGGRQTGSHGMGGRTWMAQKGSGGLKGGSGRRDARARNSTEEIHPAFAARRKAKRRKR